MMLSGRLSEKVSLIRKFKRRMGKNFITPNIIGYRVKGNRVIEFSRGDFLGKDIFGVTVRDYVDGKWQDKGLSKSFGSKRVARSYIERVRNKSKLMKVV